MIQTITRKAPEENGIHRTTWNMTEKGVTRPSRTERRGGGGGFQFGPSGPSVLPGDFKLRLSYAGAKDSTMITVMADPRYNTPRSVLEARYNMTKDLEKLTTAAEQASARLRESLKITDEYEKKIKELKRDELKEAGTKTKAMKDSVNALLDYMFGKEDERQGITRNPDPTPLSYIFVAQSYIGSSNEPINETDRRVFKHAEDKVSEMITKVNAFYEKQWPEYKTFMEKQNISPFKDYKPIQKQ